MGTVLIDVWSFYHFIGGILARLVIFPNNVLLSFIISFILHLVCELIEHTKNPHTGQKLENTKNKVSDMIMFCLGWLVVQMFYVYIKKSKTYNNKKVYFILLSMFIAGTVLEYMREIFPNNKINGAFL